jgi:hypothetical protein
MYRRANGERLEALQYALRVMEEQSHMGLGDCAADNIRRMLLRQIARLEDALARESAAGTTSTTTIPEVPES